MSSKIDKEFQLLSKKFDFNGIFKPTLTSKLLINSSVNIVKNKKKILDLGCGGGIVTGCLYKLNKKANYFLSDISKTAVSKAKTNLGSFKGNFTFKVGDSLKPWKNNKFDLIINDISGISNKVSKVSPWFKNVPMDKSVDGTFLLSKVLKQISNLMDENSIIIFPIISLCNIQKANKIVKENLKVLEKHKFEWPLPKSMIKDINLFESLRKKKIISYKKKYGIIVCNTTIIIASKC